MKISTTITKLILLALFLVPNSISAQNQSINVKGTQIQVSSNLQTVLEQVDVIYAKPAGFTIHNISNDNPKLIPVFLGFIMQRQELMMNEIRNLKHLDNEFVLIDEIDTFLSKLAKAHNYYNPTNGSKMPPIQLQTSFGEALKGIQNDSFKAHFGIDPTTVNIAYLLDRAPSNTTPSNTDDYGKIHVANDEAPTEINLLGESVIGGATVPQDTAISGNATKTGLFIANKHVCPERGNKDFTIKQGKTTGAYCSYKDGLLRSQNSYEGWWSEDGHFNSNGKKHGLQLIYNVSKDGKRYLSSQKYYANGKEHGVSVTNHEYTYQGNRLGKGWSYTYVNGQIHGPHKKWYMTDWGVNYVQEEYNYKNGKMNGIKKYYIIPRKGGKRYVGSLTSFNNGIIQNIKNYSVLKSGKHYLLEETKYNNGKPLEATYYHSSGGIQAKTTYTADFHTSSFICLTKNGKEMDVGEAKNYYDVDWMNTDWCKDKKTCTKMVFD